uniref:SOCS box domain-containing protein n=1 Tax=Aquila chrysaetos chrysaetos TaxID=223781 RepID=A0A663DQT1_AQUCH
MVWGYAEDPPPRGGGGELNVRPSFLPAAAKPRSARAAAAKRRRGAEGRPRRRRWSAGRSCGAWLSAPGLRRPRGGETDPACAVGLPCLILATGLNDGQIKVWEVQTGHLLFSLLGHQDVVRDLSFAPNGSLILVSASRDKTLRVWDLSRDGRQVQVLSGHVQWVYCCSISPDCSMLCSAAGEKSALLWSMRSYTLIRRLEGHQSSVVSCDFSPDSALLVTASYDACVIMWDPYTGEQLRTLRHVPLHSALDYSSEVHSSEVHTSSLRSVCFSPEGLYLATVADDRLLRIWALELRSPVAFAPMTNGLCCMYFPHGGFIATGTRDGHVQFWTAPRVLSSLKHLCRKALRTFLTTYQVLALPIPRKLKEFLTYRTF